MGRPLRFPHRQRKGLMDSGLLLPLSEAGGARGAEAVAPVLPQQELPARSWSPSSPCSPWGPAPHAHPRGTSIPWPQPPGVPPGFLVSSYLHTPASPCPSYRTLAS